MAEDITEEELDLVLNVNVKGTIFANEAAFPYLKAAGGGRIVNFGSDADLHPFPRGVHYAASKGAVHSFTVRFIRMRKQIHDRKTAVNGRVSSDIRSDLSDQETEWCYVMPYKIYGVHTKSSLLITLHISHSIFDIHKKFNSSVGEVEYQG
jgi:NADP-dependent 3-hydroxy acid dehydrogenase YdfG